MDKPNITEFCISRLDAEKQIADGILSKLYDSIGDRNETDEQAITLAEAIKNIKGVLRSIGVKRRIITRHSRVIICGMECCQFCSKADLLLPFPCDDVYDVASLWSDDADYNPDWAPFAEGETNAR